MIKQDLTEFKGNYASRFETTKCFNAPAIPAERRNALRAAFMATMSDPQFLSDAAKSQIDVNPMSGAEVEAFIARIASSSPDVVERARRATRAD